MTHATSDNVSLVTGLYTAFGRGDVDAVVDAMHPEIEWHESEHSPWHVAGGHHGPAEVVAKVLARIPELFDHFAVDPHAVHDAGAIVVVEGRYRATATGSGQPLDAEVCHVWTVRDGKAARFRQYTDTLQLARATGAELG